jgi:hypothetical protein
MSTSEELRQEYFQLKRDRAAGKPVTREQIDAKDQAAKKAMQREIDQGQR